MITIHTSLGDITLELDTENTPNTANNFLNYVKSGHYDNTIFHRVIRNFMIQAGGYDSDFNEYETQTPIQNEADCAQKNTRGTIAMARTRDPHSATAQFFINTKDNSFLNFVSKTDDGWGYCVFGQVTRGLDIVDAIQNVETTSKRGHDDVPVEPIIIHTIRIE